MSKEQERIYNYKFSKVNALKKGGSGAYSLEEICLKVNPAVGNVKAILVKCYPYNCSFSSTFTFYAISYTP